MCTGSRCRPNMRKLTINLAVLLAVVGASSNAFALQSDRDQQMNVDANYWKSARSQSGAASDPSIDNLDGNVQITQGSMKAHGDHATIYRNPASVADANGNNGSLTRVLLTGKQAHMEQLHDDDCGLMTADADTIDYHNDTSLAVLSGNVKVIQKGKGEFHGEHMVYNTKTGEMQSGDNSPQSRVSMRFEPKSADTPAVSSNNCGYPGGVKKTPKKTADKANHDKSDDKSGKAQEDKQ